MKALVEGPNGLLQIKLNKPSTMYVDGAVMTNQESNEENPRKYFFFIGIPYAECWTGTYQFLPPTELLYGQKQHFDATKYSGSKVYKSEEEEKKRREENKDYKIDPDNPDRERIHQIYEDMGCFLVRNCFLLNLYVPKYAEDSEIKPLPVLVYFHGSKFKDSGGFASRTPDSMMMNDIIFVTVNYRFGAFGFLNIHHKNCPGNAGLKDQAMALRWVKDNIEKFGGDPDNVTICGEGSGGTCVNFHLIAPLSQGLFHKAIIQSGGIYTPWGFGEHQRQLLNHYKEHKSFDNFRPEQFVREMKKARVGEVLEYYVEETQKDKNLLRSCIQIGPTYETILDKSTFLHVSTTIEDLIKQAKPVPLLVGITEEEGNVIFKNKERMSLADHVKWVKKDKDFGTFIKECLHWSEQIKDDSLIGAIRKHYYPNLGKMTSELEADKCLAKLCGDLWYYRFYENFKLGDPTVMEESPSMYVYKFNYRTDLNPSKKYQPPDSGATYKDDLAYLCCRAKVKSGMIPFQPDILQKIKTMSGLWAGFCRDGIPSCTANDIVWTAHTEENPCYLHIDNERLEMINGYVNADNWRFLRNIFEKKQNLKESRESLPRTTNRLASLQMTLQEAFNCFFTCTSNTELSEGAHTSTSAPRLTVSEQSGRSQTTTLEVPDSGSTKRHSPSRSPTSESKTSKDESSGPKKEKTA